MNDRETFDDNVVVFPEYDEYDVNEVFNYDDKDFLKDAGYGVNEQY